MGLTYKNDLTGKRFGRLTVMRHVPTTNGKTFWLCKCDCGNLTTVGYGNLKNGYVKSCGCLRREIVAEQLRNQSKKHGMFGTRIYRIWGCMKDRCYNKKHTAYKNYGGRGITVCEEWRNNFQSFYEWAKSSGYQDDLTIDRIDVNGNYEPSNCKWSTKSEQCKNKRNTIYLEICGETKTLVQWAKESGVSNKCIRYRVKNGWPEEELLIPPTMATAKRKNRHKNRKEDNNAG